MLAIDRNGPEWHIGKKFPISWQGIYDVESIQADGDELGKILREIDGIPKHTGHVQRWFGDHAKFICAFLQGKYWKG